MLYGLECLKYFFAVGFVLETVARSLSDQLDVAEEQIRVLRGALEEIRDTARVSEGVEFYAMLADKALNGER